MNKGGIPSSTYLKQNNIEVAEIKSLVPHEDVDLNRLTRTLRAIKFEKALIKPIIIDNRKNIIIDGHHRFKALTLLGVRYIPVVVADYHRDILEINSWMYVASSMRLSHRDAISLVEAIEALSKRGNNYVVVKIEESVYKINVDNLDIYLALNDYLGSITKLGLIKIPTNMKLCFANDICLAMPKLSVDDIYRLTLRGEVLPPRTTYHVTPLKLIRSFHPLRILHRE